MTGSRTAGAVAALSQLAAGELAAAVIPGARGPIDGVGKWMIDMSPGPITDIVIATAQSYDKALLRANIVGGSVAVGALASTGGRRRASATLSLLGATSGIAAASCEDARTLPTLVAAAAGTMAGRAALDVFGPRPTTRAFAAVAGAAGVAALSAAAVRRARRRTLDGKRAAVALPPSSPIEDGLPVPGISRLYTPNASFYETDVTARPPRLDPERWRLRVHGMVDRSLDLTLDELTSLGVVELDATLVCVHNPVGGDRIGTARWLGVPLASLLERAGVRAGAEQLVARSVDGFSAGVPVEHLKSGAPGLLAIAMNGEPLPFEHGFPARLIVPGLWGADANTKWVTELELTTWDAVRDYWDRRGWPRQPSRVQPAARIDVPANRAVFEPGPVTVAGVAWAPPGGVEGVEVQIDEGPWQPAELGLEVAPTMWRQWRLTWLAEAGDHVLRARTRGRDRLQPDGAEPPYPVGSRGYHERRVSVAAGRSGPRRVAAVVDDARERVALAGRGAAAWRERGYPPAPRFPAPPAGLWGKRGK